MTMSDVVSPSPRVGGGRRNGLGPFFKSATESSQLQPLRRCQRRIRSK